MAQLSSIPVEDVFDRLIDVALVYEVVARHNGLFGNGERLILVEGKAVSDVHGEIAFIIEFEALSGAYASATSTSFAEQNDGRLDIRFRDALGENLT